ncbi:MAG: Fe-S cluster assembly protein SufD [Beijerinckiaceae bacterium]|nr:Fe-S cluster assembly protein SufD [Beijerinckiaceae bacterium]
MNAQVTPLRTIAESRLASDYESARATMPGHAGVASLRDGAFAAFMHAGLPNRRVEAWHYTDLRQAMRDALPVAGVPAATAILAQGARLETLAPRVEGVDSVRIVLVDGYYIPALSDVARMPEGVTLHSLTDVLEQGDEQLIEALSGPGLGAGDSTLALNAAFMQGGVLLDVAAGAQVATPVEIVTMTTNDVAQALYVRSLVRLGAGSKLTLIETDASDAEVAEQRNGALVVQAGDDAVLDHVFMPAQLPARSTQVAHMLVTMGARSDLASFTLARGGGLLRRQAFLRFDGEHARGAFAGSTLLKGRDHSDTTLVVEHVAPHCESREYFKFVLDGEATGVFQGKVIVAPGAQKTDGKMKSQAILLSDGASMNNKPELEIFADDVVCGHGATVAQLDENQIFYAQSRGIPRPQVEAMLLEAFVDEATDHVRHEGLRDLLTARIGVWMANRSAA